MNMVWSKQQAKMDQTLYFSGFQGVLTLHEAVMKKGSKFWYFLFWNNSHTIEWLISANTWNIELNMQKYFVQYFLVLTLKPSNSIFFLYPWLQDIFNVRKPKEEKNVSCG